MTCANLASQQLAQRATSVAAAGEAVGPLRRHRHYPTAQQATSVAPPRPAEQRWYYAAFPADAALAPRLSARAAGPCASPSSVASAPAQRIQTGRRTQHAIPRQAQHTVRLSPRDHRSRSQIRRLPALSACRAHPEADAAVGGGQSSHTTSSAHKARSTLPSICPAALDWARRPTTGEESFGSRRGKTSQTALRRNFNAAERFSPAPPVAFLQ